ncbi:MAG TPA: ABC transporter ATP-binding protein [Terriglobia bacterium]|nr:ABC transporter ATP-binding protein [Terriglobia bacterium]
MNRSSDEPMTPSNSVLLRAENLAKVYRSGDDNVVVFDNLSLEIRQGEFVALVGESGAGKSTLLHLLGALDTPTRGEVYFAGERVSGYNARERARYRSLKAGFVWQMHYLLPEFSALENVMMPGLIRGGRFEEMRRRASDLLAEVGLEHAQARQTGELSGGEQQRVALARALINRPALLLADEPTGNLDALSAVRVRELLERLHRNHGLTSVLATHNMELAQSAHRALRLAEGKLTEITLPRVQ